eukprot:6186963-Pleurochrysis_carterae.AAC.1
MHRPYEGMSPPYCTTDVRFYRRYRARTTGLLVGVQPVTAFSFAIQLGLRLLAEPVTPGVKYGPRYC